jgi:hypothetical protein
LKKNSNILYMINPDFLLGFFKDVCLTTGLASGLALSEVAA